jgi:predicted transcriptional regulator of viral defense system
MIYMPSSVELRQTITVEEIPVEMLLKTLERYSSPRDAISNLVSQGMLVRISPRWYVWGQGLRRRPICLPYISNVLYGPSYVSLEYALAFYGMIPERVHQITAVTTLRGKKIQTPVGNFSYSTIPQGAFQRGFGRQEMGPSIHALIATPEKALSDSVYRARGLILRTLDDVETYLIDNLRIDEDSLFDLNPNKMAEIALGYGSRRVTMLSEYIRCRGGR